MQISLHRVIPLPIVELPHKDSQIWEAENIDFQRNRSYLINAASGKGKTSLLSTIYGIRKDYRGEVLIDNQDIRKFSLIQWSEIRKRKLSYIFQGIRLFDELSALENILLKNKLTKNRDAE